MPTNRSDRARSHSPPVTRRGYLAATGSASVLGLAGCLGDDTFDETELVFWHQESVPHRVDVFDDFIDRFNEEHDDVQVTQEPQPWDEVFGALTSALQADAAPDFMFSLAPFTMTFQAMGELVDVSELADRIDSEFGYFDGVMDAFQYDGGTWGVPMWDMIYLLHYRESVYGEGWSPSDTEDWLDAAEEHTNDAYGYILPANENLWTTQHVYQMMVAHDAYVYGPDGGIMFDTPETVDALDFYQRMFAAASPSDATAWDWADWERALLQETSMSTTGFTSWIRDLQETDHHDDWGASPIPTADGDGQSIHYVNNIMVFNEDVLDEIGIWLEWMHQPETYGDWLANFEPTLFLPVTEAGEGSDAYWEHDLISQYEEMIQAQFNEIPNATLYGFRDMHIEEDLYLPSVGELEGSHVLASIGQEMIVEDLSPEEAAEMGQDRLENALEVEASDHL